MPRQGVFHQYDDAGAVHFDGLYAEEDTPRELRALLVLAAIAACDDPVAPIPPGVFASVAGGFEHTCALLGDGSAYCWGYGGNFQLGTGHDHLRDSLPQAAAGALAFAQVDAGWWHSCAITTAGAAYCWGVGSDGELGQGQTPSPTPTAVDGGIAFARVALGRGFTCGLSTAGAAYCWGDNSSRQLGYDTSQSVMSPVRVSGGHVFSVLTAGDYHACGLTPAGAAWCWGSNSQGQTGTGASGATPLQVTGNLSFEAIDAGNTHTCAITRAGAAYCWGSNLLGMLGDGSRTNRSAPVAVTSSSTYTTVSVGTNHSCAITTSGQLDCWGNNNSYGGAATGTCPIGGVTPDIPCSLAPIRIASNLRFRSVGAGTSHTCGILMAGGAMCWGINFQGQVGNGEVGNIVATPTRVADP